MFSQSQLVIRGWNGEKRTCKMLWRRANATRLDSANISNSQFAREERVLAKGFKIPATERVTMKTDCRGKQSRGGFRFALV